jgi:hypothetical protein
MPVLLLLTLPLTIQLPKLIMAATRPGFGFSLPSGCGLPWSGAPMAGVPEICHIDMLVGQLARHYAPAQRWGTVHEEISIVKGNGDD